MRKSMFYCCQAFVSDEHIDISKFGLWTALDGRFLNNLEEFGWKILSIQDKGVRWLRSRKAASVMDCGKDDFGKYKRYFLKILAPDKEEAAKCAMTFILTDTGLKDKVDPQTVDISIFPGIGRMAYT